MSELHKAAVQATLAEKVPEITQHQPLDQDVSDSDMSDIEVVAETTTTTTTKRKRASRAAAPEQPNIVITPEIAAYARAQYKLSRQIGLTQPSPQSHRVTLFGLSGIARQVSALNAELTDAVTNCLAATQTELDVDSKGLLALDFGNVAIELSARINFPVGKPLVIPLSIFAAICQQACRSVGSMAEDQTQRSNKKKRSNAESETESGGETVAQ